MSRNSASIGPPEADDRFARLISDLEDLASLLDRHGEAHWCRWARTALSEVQRHDVRGLHRLRRGYGGMGSVNDLVLDGGDDGVESRHEVNAELDGLRTRIFDDVVTLLREGSACSDRSTSR